MASPRNYENGTLKVSVFDNVVNDKEGKAKEIKSFKVEKSYYDDKTNEWKQTQNLNANDVHKLIVLLQRAAGEELVTKRQN